MPVILNVPAILKPDGANAVFADGSDLSCSANTGYSNPAVSASCDISLVKAADNTSDRLTVRCNIYYNYMGNTYLQSATDDWTITIQYE